MHIYFLEKSCSELKQRSIAKRRQKRRNEGVGTDRTNRSKMVDPTIVTIIINVNKIHTEIKYKFLDCIKGQTSTLSCLKEMNFKYNNTDF